MSLNYTTLQSTVLDYAERGDLTTEVVGFIRLAEGMIRRDVKAQETRFTLDEDDRSSLGVYNLPDSIQEVRVVYGTGANGSTYAMENVGVVGIRQLPANADVQHYAVTGSTIEFRGVPATDEEMVVIGFGWPEELATTATNDLLTDHEALYVYGALYHLYLYTQDLELADKARQIFDEAAEKLNRQIGRKTGGGSVLPAYNFGHVTVGGGY